MHENTRLRKVVADLSLDKEALSSDNGPEFTSKAGPMTKGRARNINLHFIQPGKPTQNCYVESLNGKFRDECWNENWFVSLDHARGRIAAWRTDYNEVRPHRSLSQKTPKEYLRAQRNGFRGVGRSTVLS